MGLNAPDYWTQRLTIAGLSGPRLLWLAIVIALGTLAVGLLAMWTSAPRRADSGDLEADDFVAVLGQARDDMRGPADMTFYELEHMLAAGLLLATPWARTDEARRMQWRH